MGGPSKVVGVYLTASGKWHVTLKVKGVHKHFGTYRAKEEAEAVALREAKRIQGETMYGYKPQLRKL